MPQTGEVPTASYITNWKLHNTINPVIDRLLTQVKPWGTLPTNTALDYAATTFTTPFSNNSDNLIVKLDQRLKLFSPSDLLTGRYFFAQGQQSFPLGMLNTGSTAPGYNTSTPTHVNIVSLSYTSAPKSNLVFELRGGYNRFYQGFFPQDSSFNPASIGLNTLPPGYTSADLGLPSIRVYDSNGGSFSPIGSTSSDSRARIDTNYQLFGNVSLTEGTHNYKLGYEWRRTFINSYINSGHRGSLSFASLDDFLAGNIDGGSSAAGPSKRYTYQNATGAYFQDSWRLTKRFTVNYGVRWDYYGVVGEKNNQFSLFDAGRPGL